VQLRSVYVATYVATTSQLRRNLQFLLFRKKSRCKFHETRVEIEGSTCVTIPPVRMSWVVTHEAATTIKNTCGITRSALKKLLVDVFFFSYARRYSHGPSGRKTTTLLENVVVFRPPLLALKSTQIPKSAKNAKMPKCPKNWGCEGLRGVARGCELGLRPRQRVYPSCRRFESVARDMPTSRCALDRCTLCRSVKCRSPLNSNPCALW